MVIRSTRGHIAAVGCHRRACDRCVYQQLQLPLVSSGKLILCLTPTGNIQNVPFDSLCLQHFLEDIFNHALTSSVGPVCCTVDVDSSS